MNSPAITAAPRGLASDAFHTSAQTHWSLGLMLLLGVINVIDSGIIAALITPIKEEFLLTDEQIARLSSVFTFSGMVAAPLFGYLAGRFGRKFTILTGALIWSLASIGSGFATGLVSLLLWRGLTGFGEAAYHGLAPSWLADLYRPRWRALVFAAYMIKNKIGTAIALALGGWAAARYGWQTAFLIAGLPGLVLVLAMLWLKEPVAGAADGQASRRKIGFAEGLQVFRHPGFVIHTLGVFLFMAAMTGQAWIPSYLHRVFDISNKQASLFLAQLLLYTLPAGLVGGYLSSRYLRRSAIGFPLFLAFTMLAAAGLMTVAYSSRDLTTVQWLIGAATASFGMSMGPMATLSMETIPPALRPHATFLVVPLQGVFLIIASQLYGVLSDRFGLQQAIFLTPAGYLSAGLVWVAFVLWHRRAQLNSTYY